MKKISFCIPCYRSALSIQGVVQEIDDTMEKLSEYEYEIILVNDYSPDDTLSVIREICANNPRVTGIHLSRNFGQHAALMAGMQQSSGDVVVCLDDDGQTPACEVHKLLEKIEEGYDVVYAKYSNKLHSKFRNFGTKINELMTRFMLGKPKDLQVTSYFAARRFVVDNMLTYQNSFPYVIGLVLRATKNIANVEVTHRERTTGSSGYTISKLFGLWFNGFTAFSIKPLRIATFVGCFSAVMGFMYGIYIIIRKLVDPRVVLGFSSIMAAILFFCGMIMIMLGLIGEYIGRMYISMNNSPQYLVKEVIEPVKEEEYGTKN
ncbi:MAG: glycosyltransferase [Lachnospiraceae bacterium]|nr:glycosyltransferase [Lachnospiraceae bacterium]